MRMSVAEYKAYLNQGFSGETKSKYGNKFTVYNGRKYHSQKEAERARELDMMLMQKLIKSWQPQVRIKVEINGQLITTYIADFEITENNGSVRYEDVKGYRKGLAYQMFKLKKKLVKAVHNIDVIEI